MSKAIQDKIEIVPTGLYSVEEVANILGFTGSRKSKMNRVYEIDSHELPRTRTGPKGGKVMFLGRNLLRYIEDRTEEAA